MKTIRKNPLKRTVALLLTICLLLAVMIPAASAEALNAEDAEILTGAVAGEFDFGKTPMAAIGQVNGHDYLFLPHIKTLFVYDLDTWEKVDSKPIPFNTNTYGCLVDSNGIVWCYGSNDLLYRYDPVTRTGGSTSHMEIEGANHIQDVIEVNRKLYLATYNQTMLVEYDPATDTYTNLGRLCEDDNAVRAGSLGYKDGYIYASVHNSKATTPPNFVVKYDLANKKVVDSLDINARSKDTWTRQMVICGDTLMLASFWTPTCIAVDISGEKMAFKDIGVTEGAANGFSKVIVEKDEAGNVINEKVYFFQWKNRVKTDEEGWTCSGYLAEYNSNTGKATPVENFPHESAADYVNDYIHTKRGCLVTVDRPKIEGWTGPSIFTFTRRGSLALYNLASGKIWRQDWLDEGGTLMSNDGSPKNIICLNPGPEGSNILYLGNYMVGYVTEYDITTGAMKRYKAYSSQVPEIYWYDGKCYATGYGAGSLCEVGIETGDVKVLFELASPNNKPYFFQERLHNMTSGDGKIFTSTAPCKNYLGGYLAWYDLETKTTYVAVEKDKVLYQKDSDKTAWYDAKTDTPHTLAYTDGTTKEFSGLIANQIPRNVVYQDGYVYGGTGISGGSGADPKEGESAVIFAYDVANMKLVTLDPRTVIEGLPEIINNIFSVAADPDVPGKFWGQVLGTLFSFTYDKEAETFNVKEEISFSKKDDGSYGGTWSGGLIAFEDGYIITDVRDEGFEAGMKTIRMICKDDPSYNFVLAEYPGTFTYGEDNNLYVVTEDQGIARLNTANRIAEIKANKVALDAAEEKINAIGEVTLESEEAIQAARAAYDALAEEVKGMVDPSALEAAESKLAELKAAAEKAAADKAAADAATAKIEAIGEVTLESEEDIKAARAAYDALTADQKALVDAAKLTAAETALEALKKPADPDNPKIGDETDLVLPVVLMVVSVMGIAAGVVCTKKFSYKGKHQK